MKNLHHLLFPLFITIISFAQTPEKVSYQAILRDGEGILITNKELSVNLSVLQGNESGIEVYTETHFTETNANGLVSLKIGSGQAYGPVFSSIDWGNGPYFIKTETTVDGATLTSIAELLSVPYALHAKDASKVNGLTVATEVPENALFTDNQPAKEVDIDEIPNLDADDVQQALEQLQETLEETGDMKQTAYDSNNDSIVDNASKVNGLTVETNVPLEALFTDSQKGNEVDLAIALDVDGDGEPETTVEAALIELNKLLKHLKDEVKISSSKRILAETSESEASSTGTYRPCLVEHEGQHYFGGIQESRSGSVCAYNHKDKPYYKTFYKILDKDFLSKTKNADQTVLTYSASDGSENKLCIDQKGRYGYEKTSEEPKRCLFAVPFSNKYGSVTLTEGSSLNYEYLKLKTIRFIDDSDSGKEGQRYYRTVKDDQTYCAASDAEGISFDGQYHPDKGTCHVNGKELQTGFFMYSGSPSESDGEHRILASSQLDAYKYQIGSVINGLVLFKIYNGIYYFLSKNNLSPTTWGCNDPLDLKAGTSSNLGTGHFNTTTIAAHSNCENAARVSLNYKEGDHTEFYLPSENELKAIYEIKDHLENIDGIAPLEGIYWSSTVDVEFRSSHGHRTTVESDRVEVVDFDSGEGYGVSVNEELHVRPVLSMPSNNPELFFVTDENELHRSIRDCLETNPNYLRTWFEHNYPSPSIRYDDFTRDELLSIYMADLSIQCPDILKDGDTIDLTDSGKIMECGNCCNGGYSEAGNVGLDQNEDQDSQDGNGQQGNNENNNGDQGGQGGDGNNNQNNNPGGNSDQNPQELLADTTMTYKNGIYIGQVKNGKPHGQGKMTYENGDVYDGEFKDGQSNGHGTYIFANEVKYEGDWENGYPHGEGKMTYVPDSPFWFYKPQYIGQWKNGKRHGEGTMIGPARSFYNGWWKDGKRHGQGSLTYADGSIHEGEFENGELHHGQVTMIGPDGTKYEGEWKNGELDGHGTITITYGNGNKYKGSWKDGKRHGHGIFTNKDGSTYEGQWKNGIQHGKGILTFRDGSKYEGEFDSNGKLKGTLTYANGNKFEGEFDCYGHGERKGILTYVNGDKFEGEIFHGQPCKGTLTYADGGKFEGRFFLRDGKPRKGKKTYADGSTYEGAWENNKLHGYGKMTFDDGSTYEGEFKDGLANGIGTYIIKNGKYEGAWENGKRHGQGKMTFDDGSSYEGAWENGKRHGKGKVTHENGDVYEGEWKDGKMHGEGTFTFKNGTKYQGEWKNGTLMKQGEITFSQEALGQIDKFFHDHNCSICRSSLKGEENLSVLPPCNHIHHKSCLEDNERINDKKCSLCRKEYDQRLDIEADSLIKQLDEYKNQNQQNQQDQNEGADQIIKEEEKIDDEQQLDDNQGGNIELIPLLQQLIDSLNGQHDNQNVEIGTIYKLVDALNNKNPQKIKELINKLNEGINNRNDLVINPNPTLFYKAISILKIAVLNVAKPL